MIHWIATNRFAIIRHTRWVIVGCGLALLGLADMPHTETGRLIALIGICATLLVFLTWFLVALIMILHPRLFERVRRKAD